MWSCWNWYATNELCCWTDLKTVISWYDELYVMNMTQVIYMLDTDWDTKVNIDTGLVYIPGFQWGPCVNTHWLGVKQSITKVKPVVCIAMPLYIYYLPWMMDVKMRKGINSLKCQWVFNWCTTMVWLFTFVYLLHCFTVLQFTVYYYYSAFVYL